MFGRGQTTLQTTRGAVLGRRALKATCDGLIIRHVNSDQHDDFSGVRIFGGGLRMQACDITSAKANAVSIKGGADPVLASCKCAFFAQCRAGTAVPCYIAS